MDAESRAAAALLHEVGAVRGELHQHALRMWNRHGARFTASGTRVEMSGPCLMGSQQVDGTLHISTVLAPDGRRAVWWCIDVSWFEGGWLVDADVWADSAANQGQDLLIEFPRRHAQTLNACIEHLRAATRDIVNSGDVHEILDGKH